MKLNSFLIVMLLALALSSTSVSGQASLEGTWQATYHQVVLPDTTMTATGADAANLVKVINKTHFATILQGMDAESSMFNGGEYELSKDTYTEHLQYFSNPSQIGQSFTFKCKLDKDTWEIKGPVSKDGEAPSTWTIHEIYKRVH